MKHKTRKPHRKPSSANLMGLALYLHPQNTDGATWRYLPHFLLVAFVLRAVVALSGDFVIHPDEVMQYLEPAHRLVFGSGVVYWEYFYGARSWIVPGFIAAILWLCDLVGLGEPLYYIAAVKLVFCALSLLVPWGMYAFCRRHWSENTARLALILGVFWYELAVFAHKPMTEFVATSFLMLLLAIMPLSASATSRQAALTGALCAFIVAVRLQYALPVALLFLAAFFVCNKNGRLALLAGGAGMTAAVALLETATWGAPFFSYYVNFNMNVIVGGQRVGESSLLLLPGWLLLASGGLAFAAVLSVFEHARRRNLIIACILLILLPHMLQNHREYRFVFAVIPLWLILFADLIVVTASQRKHAKVWPRAACSFAVIVSLLGVSNLLPFQSSIYEGFSRESGRVNFLSNHDPMFAVYRKLNADPSVRGLLDSTRPYFNTGGYYYFHRAVPFYDSYSWSEIAAADAATPEKYVSHIITNEWVADGKPVVSEGRLFLQSDNGVIPLPAFLEDIGSEQLVYWDSLGRAHPQTAYELHERFEEHLKTADAPAAHFTVWKRKEDAPVREWKNYEIFSAGGLETVMERFLESPPVVPENYGVEFADQ